MKSLLLFLILSSGPLMVSVKASAAEKFTLTPWMKKFVTTTARGFHSFHYAPLEKLGTPALGVGVPVTGELDLKDAKISHHIQDWGLYYFQSLKHGLYLGTDPLYYRSFGGEHFALYRIKIPAGFTVLDFESHFDEQTYNQIPADAIKALVLHGCDVKPDADFENLFRGESYGMESGNCAQIVFDTVRELSVDLIEYRKGAVEISGCIPHRRQMAMILVNPSKIQESDWAFFYPEATDRDLLMERAEIEAMFLKNESFANRPWADLDELAQKPGMEDYLRANILGCENYSE